MVIGNCTDDLNKNYYILPIINLDEELTAEEKKIMEMLDNKIEKKIYTEYEYDIIKQKLNFFYYEDEKEIKKFKYSVENKGVSKEEFKDILKTFDNIDEKLYAKKLIKDFN